MIQSMTVQNLWQKTTQISRKQKYGFVSELSCFILFQVSNGTVTIIVVHNIE